MVRTGWAACAALLVAASAGAGEAHGTLQVSATVLPHARVALVGGADTLVVSPRDATRGLATARSVYEVRCNTRRGFLLEFAPRSAIAQEVEVRVGESRFVLGAEPVAIRLWDPAPRAQVDVDYRLRLREGVEAGSYELPVRVAVQPLL